MRTKLLVKIPLTIALLCSVLVAQSEWTKITSKDGGYSVLLPGQPKSMEMPFVVADFHSVAHVTLAQIPEVSYAITYSDLPGDFTDPNFADRVLKGARDNVLAKMPVKLLSETKLSLNGRKGIELKVEVSSGIILARTYVSGARMYQLIASFSKSDVIPANATKFLDSFSFTDPLPADSPEPVVVTPPPPPPPSPSPCSSNGPQPKLVARSEGVIRGNAISLIRPPYPVAAKEAGASGKVEVAILIDLEGNVEEAHAISGDPLLQEAAADAAKASKFKPTLFCGIPIKVKGILTYNFSLN